jgi:hypothetical protein
MFENPTWRGRPLADMSKDELITVIEELVVQLKAHNSAGAVRASALGRVEMMKRGEA